MHFRIDKILNTEHLDTILEDEILKSAEEEGKIEDMPGRGEFCENEGELSSVAKLKDEVGGDVGEHDEEGGVDFEELELLTCSPLLREFKSGLCKAHKRLHKAQYKILGPVFIGTNPGTERRARLTILPQPCPSPDMVTVRCSIAVWKLFYKA